MKSSAFLQSIYSLLLIAYLSLASISVPVAAEPTLLSNISSDNDIAIGKQMYREGLLPSGMPLQALVQGDVEIDGSLVTCVSCHKRSGIGSSESGKLIPAITKQALYDRIPYGLSKKSLARVNSVNKRIKYTDESLKKLLLTGITPEGRSVNPLMPKFILSEKNSNHLIAYLKTLTAEISPGVDDTILKFATIVTEDVAQTKIDAMLNVLNLFFTSKNANTRKESKRARKGPYNKESLYAGYRKWELKVWRLKGDTTTWRQQLDVFYKTDPVFAILSGISVQSWEPIHQFCEDLEIPALFPNTDLPKISDTDFYSVYFTKGLTLEAKILEKYLLNETSSNMKNKILVQIYQDDAWGTTPKSVIESSKTLNKNYSIHSIKINDPDSVNLEQIDNIITQYRPTDLVLWLLPKHITKIVSSIKQRPSVKNIYLPTSSLGTNYEPITNKAIKLLYPFEIDLDKKLRRIMYWINANKLDSTETFVIANTYFAAKMAVDVVFQMRTLLNRNVMLEKIEHMVDNAPISSVYPHVTLAPNQRFISKGSYITEYKNNNLVPITDWVIP